MTRSAHSESALRCMGGTAAPPSEADVQYLRACGGVASHTGRLARSLRPTKFKDMLFFCSWKHVHVRLRSLDCFQMCALSSLPLSLALSPLSPPLFAFISHRPPPRSELSSTSSSLPHPVCHQLWAQRIHSHMSAAFMTRTEIVLLVWIAQRELTLHLKTADNTWAACGRLS